MYMHHKERKYYEDMYDRLTVESARRNIVYYDNIYTQFEEKLPKGEKIDRPGNAYLLNVAYMQFVGDELLHRYEQREQDIKDSMARDEAKDQQIANARLTDEPYCQHCNKRGLKIIDKSLMHRKGDHKYDDPQEVLFMLRCPHCKKNSAFWEDGKEWKYFTKCPKRNAKMDVKHRETKTALYSTYTCTKCDHSYEEKMDFSSKKKKEEPDPDFDKDRIHFCLVDKEFREKLFAIRDGFERMAEFGKEFKEKQDNKHIYDAVDELKKLKIPELATTLGPIIEKAGYIEFTLDKPEVGREVTVGFSCLDSRSDREDYDSRKTLKKTFDKALEVTNWRLMSEGIHYRLGYLSGRLRAYESEEDLKKLVMKSKKLSSKQRSSDTTLESNKYTLKTPDSKEIIL